MRVASCELKRGGDFFTWRQPVDWIVTNPPWSQFRSFLQHAMAVADHVVFLVTINHLWTRARIQDIATAGFGIREIVLVDTPRSFPPLGFQLGAVHLARGWRGAIGLTDWTGQYRIPNTGLRIAENVPSEPTGRPPVARDWRRGSLTVSRPSGRTPVP